MYTIIKYTVQNKMYVLTVIKYIASSISLLPTTYDYDKKSELIRMFKYCLTNLIEI